MFSSTSYSPPAKRCSLSKIRFRSRVDARGERLPSELIHNTRLRLARRRITCFFDNGSPDQSLAKQTMSRPSRRGMDGLLHTGRAAADRGELLVPQLEHQQRPQL